MRLWCIRDCKVWRCSPCSAPRRTARFGMRILLANARSPSLSFGDYARNFSWKSIRDCTVWNENPPRECAQSQKSVRVRVSVIFREQNTLIPTLQLTHAGFFLHEYPQYALGDYARNFSRMRVLRLWLTTLTTFHFLSHTQTHTHADFVPYPFLF